MEDGRFMDGRCFLFSFFEEMLFKKITDERSLNYGSLSYRKKRKILTHKITNDSFLTNRLL